MLEFSIDIHSQTNADQSAFKILTQSELGSTIRLHLKFLASSLPLIDLLESVMCPYYFSDRLGNIIRRLNYVM